MKYCPFCQAPRDPALEVCEVCGSELETAAAGASPPPSPPPLPSGGQRPRSEPPPAAEPSPSAVAVAERPSPAAEPPPAKPPPTEPPPEEESAEDAAYREVVSAVESRLDQGFELFGFVGPTYSGKTHGLKALSYLLEQHGVDSPEARGEFLKAPVPGPTEASVFDYAYTGPGGERWVFVDVGGELYMRLRDNDWSLAEKSTALTHRLHHCRGLFMLLHLDRGHFSRRWVDVDPELYEDGREEIEAQVARAREKQHELDFFKQFLLFLRAVKLEEGDVRAVIERCREAGSLASALSSYHARAPLLDVPVMFYFTKADTYDEQGFEISDGVYLSPRREGLSTAAFVARHLPSLYAGVASQVRRFKFDFLQSYEEFETEVRDDRGRRRTETYWRAPGDDEELLSVGLLAGLEFLLRHRPGEPWWKGPGLETERALYLHRLLHPRQWRRARLKPRWRRRA